MDIKDIVLQEIQSYYEFEKSKRQQNNEPLHLPFNGIGIADLEKEILSKTTNPNITWASIEQAAQELLQEGKIKLTIYRHFTLANTP